MPVSAKDTSLGRGLVNLTAASVFEFLARYLGTKLRKIVISSLSPRHGSALEKADLALFDVELLIS